MRPRQWLKNLLVLAAPLAAGQLLEADVATKTAIAFICFCAMSSAVYLLNDVADAEADRVHPVKSKRPIAAGELTATTALMIAGLLAVLAVGGAWLVRPSLGILLLTYGLLQLAYTLRLKHEPVLDLAVVTTGFVLRAVSGGVAAQLAISDLFLLVAGFGSLFMVAGKRYSELHTLGSEAGTRRSLVRYTDTYLRFVWSIAASVTVVGYALWAFEQGDADLAAPWQSISIFPFTVAMLRYAVDIDKGMAAEPEDIVWADRGLQIIAVIWLVLVALGVAGV